MDPASMIFSSSSSETSRSAMRCAAWRVIWGATLESLAVHRRAS
jgi:hypothetical protein